MSKRTTTRERQNRRAEEKSRKKDAAPRRANAASESRAKAEPAKAEKRSAKAKPAEAKKRGAKTEPVKAEKRGAKTEPVKAEKRGPKTEPAKAEKRGAKPPVKAKNGERPRPRAVPDPPEFAEEPSPASHGATIEVTEHDLLDDPPASRVSSDGHALGTPPAGVIPETPTGEGEDAHRYLLGLIEALLFVAEQPLGLKELARAAKIDRKRTAELVEELRAKYQTRGIQIQEVAGGYCFRSNPEYAEYVRGHLAQRPVRLSRPQLETLAIIAYRQPITRPEIDDIRGVDSGPVLKGLLERDLVKILGKKDEPGRPMLYGTSQGFLSLFNMTSLQDLPTLKEFTELSEESRQHFETKLGIDAPDGPVDLSRLEASVIPSDPSEFDDDEPETGSAVEDAVPSIPAGDEQAADLRDDEEGPVNDLDRTDEWDAEEAASTGVDEDDDDDDDEDDDEEDDAGDDEEDDAGDDEEDDAGDDEEDDAGDDDDDDDDDDE